MASEIMLWVIFCNRKSFLLIFNLFKNESDWTNMLIPEKLIREEDNIKASFMFDVLQTILIPFVTSTIPATRPVAS